MTVFKMHPFRVNGVFQGGSEVPRALVSLKLKCWRGAMLHARMPRQGTLETPAKAAVARRSLH